MKLASSSLALVFLGAFTAPAAAQQLAIPPETAGNTDECFNSDGDGAACGPDQHRSGSWITGESDGIDDVALTDEGSVIIPTGSFRKHVVDYRVHFNQSDSGCGAEPIVETPHHAPFVLEFSRYFRTRASYVDYGLTRGWKENYFFLLFVSDGPGYRTARFETPSGAEMNWIDVGSTGAWSDDSSGLQSMVLTLTDEAGDQHLVTDRWGGKYHFVPNTSPRAGLQYLVDWLEDENGNRITIAYGADGYPTQATDGFGRSIVYTWTTVPFGGTKHIAAVALPNGRTLSFQYFFDGLRTYRLTYPNGEVASYGFGADADGEYRYFNDPLGEPGARKQRVYTYAFGPTFEYDTGRVRGIKDESGHVQLVRHEDPLEPRITIEYDDGRGFAYDCAFGGLNGTVTNLRTGALTSNLWQANGGLLKRKIDALGHWTTADYDDALALRVLQRHGAVSETWSYGALARVVDRVDPNGNLTHHDYDASGNLLRRTYADGSYEEWTRDARGAVTTHRNRDGHVTSYTYDARGNVAQIVRPATGAEPNPVHAFQYDVDGRLLAGTDPVGRVTTYQYDLLGRRVATLYPDGSSELVAYGAMAPASPTDPVATAGLVVQSVDRNGNVTDLEYGPNDRLERVSGAPGVIELLHDAQGRLVTRTENGDVDSYTYDVAARLATRTRTVDATHAHTTTFSYDLLDRVVLELDPHGFLSETVYTSLGQVARHSRQIGGASYTTTGYTYDPNGNVVALEQDGVVRTFVYDSNDRLVQAYDPAPFDASPTAFAYDYEGHLLSRIDPAGNTSHYGYTARGMLAVEIDPSGVTLSHEYDLDDTLQRTTSPGTNGLRSYTYDGAGRQASVRVTVDGGGADMLTQTIRDARGNVVQVVDGEGGVETYQCDARDRVVLRTDPLGQQTVTVRSDDGSPFDARLAPGQGSAVRVTDPIGRTTTSVYDGLGRLIRSIDAAGASTVYVHDVPDGDEIGTLRTDRLGHVRAVYHDGLGRVVREVDEVGNVTRYVLGASGNLLMAIDPRGNATTFQHDSMGRVTSVEQAGDDNPVSFSYLVGDRVGERIDQSGNHSQYAYDAAGRLLSVQYQDGSTDTFQYDAGGRLVTAHSGLYGNTVSRAYDRADRVVQETMGRSVQIAYDRRSLVTRITTPSGRVFDKTYTARGELDLVKLDSTTLVDLDHDAAGQLLSSTNGNGTQSSWTLGPQGWVSSVAHRRSGVDLLTLSYARDAEGRTIARRNRTNISRNEFSSYDAAGQLVYFHGKNPPVRRSPPAPGETLEGATGSLAWTLDPAGNWATLQRNRLPMEVRTHSSANELVAISGFGVLDYDKVGNLTDDGLFRYTHDFNGRLREIRPAGDPTPVATYEYDALGRRLQRNAFDKAAVAQRRFLYFYAGERVVEMREQPAVGQPDVFLSAFAHDDASGRVLVMVRPAHTYWFHHDALGNTAALTDEAGLVAERYEYDPYGRTQLMTPSWQDNGDTSEVGNPFTFHGYENDSEAGLIRIGARHLSPYFGRYLQRDPAGSGGDNLYSAAALVSPDRSDG